MEFNNGYRDRLFQEALNDPEFKKMVENTPAREMDPGALDKLRYSKDPDYFNKMNNAVGKTFTKTIDLYEDLPVKNKQLQDFENDIDYNGIIDHALKMYSDAEKFVPEARKQRLRQIYDGDKMTPIRQVHYNEDQMPPARKVYKKDNDDDIAFPVGNNLPMLVTLGMLSPSKLDNPEANSEEQYFLDQEAEKRMSEYRDGLSIFDISAKPQKYDYEVNPKNYKFTKEKPVTAEQSYKKYRGSD